MTFGEKYEELEDDFQSQVKCDNKELRIDSSYVHNFIPSGPVDFVLVAMEPSTGVPGKQWNCCKHIARNFSWSTEDFIFHYCVREYLCQNGETYHLTDLAKGGMTTRVAGKRRRERYARWYPLLEKEHRLLTKPEGTRIIAIGNVVHDFLNNKNLCERVEKVLHYSRSAAAHRDKKISPWRQQFCRFAQSVDEGALEESLKDVLSDAGMNCYYDHRPEGGKSLELTPSRKKLMFYYKNKFRELRDAAHIVLNHGR